MVISKDNIQEKTLSIRISTNGFCFCTYIPSEPESLKYFTYPTDCERSLADNLQAAIDGCPIVKQGEIYKVKAIIETGDYTCIPSEFDNKNDYKLYFRTCFPKSANCDIVANKLNTQGYTILFPVESAISDIIHKLGEVTFFTPASIIMSYLGYKPMNEKKYMLTYLYNDIAFILSMENGKARISNIFKKEDYENIVFYLLSIWNEQELSQTEDTLYICGDNSIDSFEQAVGRFIKRVKRINPNELFPSTLLNKIKGIPFDLQALILCE